MNERNMSLILAFLVAAGGVAYLGGGAPTAKGGAAMRVEARAEPPPSPAPAACALDVPCVGADYFDGTSADPNAVWYQQCRAVRHLIALVPDPVEAHIGWQFDPMVESIQRAAEANGYSFDRFALPWDEGAAKQAACLANGAAQDAGSRACGSFPTHDSLPGVMLFRNAKGPTAPPLAVYLVGETPTGGVHKRALNAAMTRVAECSDEPLAILGPTFSGSMRSLRLAIGEWWADHWPWRARNLYWRQTNPLPDGSLPSPIRMISGTTTSPPLAELDALGAADGDGPEVVSFAATVLPDAYAFTHLVNGYLHGELGVPLRDIALLVEANSGYGQSLQALGRGTDQQAEGGAAAAHPDAVMTLTFPMHIAEARAAVEKARASAAAENAVVPGVVRPDLVPWLGDSHKPLDLLPQMHPQVTLPAAEFALANLLATISRNDIKYVGLLASDTRDKLFLAQQVRKYCPDVRLFTFESDLLYAHPDQRRALAGMLVASTYPLFNRTQAWTTRVDAPRLQFPSSGAQGVYNATLVLLGYNAEWLMADYAFPHGWTQSSGRAARTVVKQRPMLWISTVGNSGLWPLKLYVPDEAELDHVWYRRADIGEQGLRPDGRVERGSARSALLVWALLTVFCLAQVVRYFAANRLGGSGAFAQWLDGVASDAYRARDHARGEQFLYLLVCFLTLMVVYGVWSHPFFIESEAVPLGVGRPVIVLTLAALAGVLFDAISALALRRNVGLLGHVRRLERAAVLAVPIVLAVGAPRLPVPALLSGGSPADDMVAYERFTGLESQLSPLLPCLLVAAAWFLWSYGQLQRLALTDRAVRNVLHDDGTRGKGLAAAERAARLVIGRPWTRPLVVGAVLVWLVPCVLVGTAFVPTYEGRVFDVCFEAAFFLASLGVVAAFAQTLALWWQIRRLLDRLAAHPLAAAFARQPPRLVERVRDSLYAYAPTLVDLEFTGDSLRRLVAGFAAVRQALAVHLGLAADGMVEVGQGLATLRDAAENELGEAAKADRHRDVDRYAQRAQAALDSAAGALVHDVLTPVWNSGAVPEAAEAKAWLEKSEDFVAAQSLAHLGYLFLHVRTLMTIATGGMVLLLLAIPSYPFQPQRLLNMFIWVLVLAAVAGVLMALLQMNRSEVLSKLTGSTPNEVNFDRTLLSPLLKYGALPLVSLIATQFPGIGETIFSWVEPALRAMK